jgi:hypothetical protein
MLSRSQQVKLSHDRFLLDPLQIIIIQSTDVIQFELLI